VDLRQLSDLVVGLVSTVADVLGRDGQTLQEVGVRKHVIAQVNIWILLLATELHERIQLHHGSECGWVLVLAPFKTQLQTNHGLDGKTVLLGKPFSECKAMRVDEMGRCNLEWRRLHVISALLVLG